MKKSDHVCWWCFHKFDGIPIGVPEKMVKTNFIYMVIFVVLIVH